MTSDEKYIRQKVGSKNPFKVPEGYFDSVAPAVMERLAEYPGRKLESQKKTIQTKVVLMAERMRPLLYVAATLFVAVFTFSVYFQNMSEDADQKVVSQISTNDDFFDEEADYVMMDNYDIYACLISDY